MRFGIVLALTLAATAVGGYSSWKYYQERYPSWLEEVQLSDGRRISIEQKHEVYEGYGTAQAWVTINLPELGGRQVWHSYLMPQRVDVVDGKVYVFGVPRGVREYAHYHDPKHYMVAFRWDGQAFARVPFAELPQAIREEENVYPCVPPRGDRPLSFALKEKKWCPVRGDRWKFGKQIRVSDYEALASFYSGLKNAQPSSN